MSLLVLLWVLAVPTASVLGVLALRAAEGGTSTAVLSAGEAASLATASPPASESSGDGTAPPDGTAAPTTTPAPTPDVGVVTERRVPGAVLGLRCDRTTPVLVWSVPDPGWQVDRAEIEDGALRVRVESDDEEVQVTVVCQEDEPVVVGATRDDD